MSLYSITKIIIFILIQLKDFSSTQEIHLENDLTKHIDEWVTSIFSISGNDGVHIITQMIGCTPKEFEYNITNHVNHSQTEFLFQRIHLTLKGESEQIEFDRPQIHWNFAENKINFVFLEIRIKIQAGIAIAKAQPRGKRCSSMNDYICWCSFENFTISAVGTRVKDDQLKVSYNTTYSSFGITDLRTFNQISMNENKNLVQEITPAMQMILEQNFHNNVKFIHELDKIFQVQEEPRKKIISAHPHFSTNPQQCNYLIQEIPFLGFILKRIVISGMSNFESYNVDHSSNETYTRTLLIRNVQGNMTLDYRTEKEIPLELNFQIDCLMVSKNDETDRVYGLPKKYTVTRTNTNVLLSPAQSEMILSRLGSAIASKLLSKQDEKNCTQETPQENMRTSNASDWETIKESYRGWIPLNDDEVVTR